MQLEVLDTKEREKNPSECESNLRDGEIKYETKFEDDPLFSFIVPIHNISPSILKRCLMSLQSQEYGDFEVICVLDGPNEELKKVCEFYLKDKKFKLIQIEHGGACAARNAGFLASNGEIVSFFNSDYIAKPGMLRMWVDALQRNKDCGFAYGGYEYSSNRRWSYPSKAFNADELFTANYIDCGFPLWRKYVVEWDPTVKSLQDWDFWIRVVKTHNVKGFYLGRDYSFIAEPPRPKGLTDDSSNNWIDRVRYIKTKNNIPEREIVITSLGAGNHGREIAKLIGGDFRDDTILKPSEYKALYMIGFYINPNEQGLNEHSRILAWFKDYYPKCKRIVHFVGADIYKLRKFPYESLKYLAGALRISVDHILCENQGAQDELKEYGIPAEIVPIPSYTNDWEVKPLPKDFKVSLYMVEPGYGVGQSDFDKMVYEPVLSIVRGMPDIQFTAYGNGAQNVQYPNLKHYKTIPRDKWPRYVYENSALLRLVRHDTKPLASNEFMLAGRDVISNIPDECTDYIDTSGHHEINEWDKFSEGFNASNWPDTKAKIIRKIREVKNRVVPESERLELHKKLYFMRDHESYIRRIKELCDVK